MTRTQRAYWAVGWLFFVCGLGNTNVLARLPTLRDSLGLGEQTLGFVLLAGAAGALVAFRVAGPLMHRFGSRRVAALAATLFSVAIVLPAWASGAASAALGFGIMGAASGLMDVSMNVQGLVVERSCERPLMSTLHALASLGGLCGAAMGAWCAHLQLAPYLHFALLTGVLAPSCALSLRLLLEEADGESAKAASPLTHPGGPLLLLGLIAFCSSVGEGAMADWVTIYLRDALGAELGHAGIGFVAFSLTMVTCRLLGDRLSHRFDTRTTLTAGGLLASSGLGLGLALNSYFSVVVGAAVAGIGLAPIVPSVLRAVGRLYPANASRALANIATLSYGGFLLGPPCIGFVGEHVGLRAGLLVVVAAAGLMAILARRLPQISTAGRAIASP